MVREPTSTSRGPRAIRSTAATIAFAGLVGACASGGASVPPLNPAPTQQSLPGKFVWHDLVTEDPAGSRDFYADLFGWTFAGVPGFDNYEIASHNGRPVAGMVRLEALDDMQFNRSQWISYISVSDVDAMVAEITAAGGRVFAEPRDLEGRGRYAVVSDHQGATFALLRSVTGDPADTEPANGDWLWDELWTLNADHAMSFYESLMGYERTTMEMPGSDEDYRLLAQNGTARAGVLQHRIQELPANWLPYVKVADVDAIVQRVPALGGRVIYAPRQTARNGSVAIVADPSGAAVTVQEWPPAGSSGGRAP